MSQAPLTLHIRNTQLHGIDSQCFYAENAWIYLKCKLPFSVLATAKNSHKLIHRVLSVRHATKNIETNLNILFSVDKRVQRIEDTRVEITRINCTNDATELASFNYDSLILNESYKNHFSFLPKNLNIEYQNSTFVNLVYMLNVTRLNANTLIWPIEMLNRSSDLCTFRLVDDDDDDSGSKGLFEIESGIYLKTSLDWSLPWSRLAVSFKYSLKLETLKCYSNQSNRIIIDVNVIFSLEQFSQIHLTLDDIPVPKLTRANYDLSIDDSKSDLLLLENIDIILVHESKRIGHGLNELKRFYNVTFSLKMSQEMPFYIDALKGELFYSRDTHLNKYEQDYEFKIEINFHFVYNESLKFSLYPNVRVRMNRDVNEQIESEQTSHTRLVHGQLDFSLPVTSADLREFLKCPLIAQFRFFPSLNNQHGIKYKLVNNLPPKTFNNNTTMAYKTKKKVASNGQKYKNVYKYSSKTRKRTSKVRAKVREALFKNIFTLLKNKSV